MTPTDVSSGMSLIAESTDPRVTVHFEPRAPGASSSIDPLVSTSSDRTLGADSAPALVTLPTGFSEPELRDPGRLRYALISPSGVAYAGIRARKAGVFRLSFLAEPPPGGLRVLRVADETGTEQPFTLHGPTEVSVLVQVPRGYSLLGLKTDPAPTSSEDAIRVSGFRTERAEVVTDLEAHLVEDDPGF